MAQVVVAQRMWQRRDSAANWTSGNPILAAGEIGVEHAAIIGGTPKFKIGDGVTAWADLSYLGEGTGLVLTVGSGTGVSVDSSDPENPIVALSSAALLSLSAADSAVQPGDLASIATSGAVGDLTAFPGGTTGFLRADGVFAAPPGGGGGGGGYTEVTSNPTTPAVGDKVYRSDLNLLIFFDGTRWLSVQEYDLASSTADVLAGATTSGNGRARWSIRSDFGVYLTRWACSTYSSSLNASNYWNLLFQVNSVTIASFNTSADTSAVHTNHDTVLSVAVPPAAVQPICIATKQGNPGGLYCPMSLIYRLIVT